MWNSLSKIFKNIGSDMDSANLKIHPEVSAAQLTFTPI